MAMTKAEKAALEAALTVGALRYSGTPGERIKRDVQAPAGWNRQPEEPEYVTGWDYNAHSLRIERMWTGASAHGSGDLLANGKRPQSASQNGRALFSTRLLALQAMRRAMEDDFAQKLRRVDQLIEEEQRSTLAERITATGEQA